ncbi:MAG: hypothetical protein IPM02_08905 [Betaproteobacteria bacterium]|nr:hypothetical protein [Betaproteobacteria bacterium]
MLRTTMLTDGGGAVIGCGMKKAGATIVAPAFFRQRPAITFGAIASSLAAIAALSGGVLGGVGCLGSGILDGIASGDGGVLGGIADLHGGILGGVGGLAGGVLRGVSRCGGSSGGRRCGSRRGGRRRGSGLVAASGEAEGQQSNSDQGLVHFEFP